MPTLQTVLVGLASALMLLWLVVVIRRPRKVDVAGVLVVLRYGSALRVLALILAWGAPALVIFALWNFPPRNEKTLLVAGIGFLALSAIPGLLLIEVERMQIAVTEDAIIRYSPWTGRCSVQWQDVQRIHYSTMNRWFIITAPTGKIRVSRHLLGVAEFIRTARRKLATNRYSGAVAVFDACS